MAKRKKEEEQRESIVDIVKLLAKERDIDEEEIFKAIESGIVAAYRREFDAQKRIKIVKADIDRETGEIYVYRMLEIVEEVLDPENEIAIEDAREAGLDEEYCTVGNMIPLSIEVEELGSLAADAAKNSIKQKLKEAEGVKIQREFADKKDRIVTGTIIRKDNNAVYVSIGRAEAIVKRGGQVRNDRERYEQDRKMKFIVKGIEEAGGRPTVVLSRTDPELVKQLFAMEVPEIKAGDVIIKSVAREPGSRSKIAVYSRDPDIDAKGACVGQRGQRVQQVMAELSDEKIDIVDYKEDPALFISEALQPAKALRVDIEISNNEDGVVEQRAKVIVPDDQFSLAIGKSGQNVRLAAKLTGFSIDIRRESDESDEAVRDLTEGFQVAEEGEE